MQITLIVGETLHVLAGVFWAGTTFAMARMGAEQAGQVLRPQLGAAVVAIATGASLWFFLHRGNAGLQEQVLGLGAMFAVVAAGVQAATGVGIRRRLATVGDLEAPRSRPHPAIGQRIAAFLLAVTVACMAAARYL
jgi:hypothetical protein